MKPWAELAAPWQACLEQAWAAYQAGSLPVGAEPCALCVGAIRMLALKDVRYAARDAAAGSLDLFDASDFMRRGRVQARHFDHRELEAVLIAMNTDALLSISARVELRLPLDRWESAGLPGVDFGRRLFASGELRRLADSPNVTIDHVLGELVSGYRLQCPCVQ